LSRSLKKNLISLGVALLVLAVTFFTAAIEYQSNVSQQKQDLDESLEVVKNKWENVIEARVLGLKGLISYVEINPEFSQEEYEAFARGLYESQDDIVTNIALLKDTTVTYVYPYNMNLLAVGRDLVLEEGQRDFVRYTKNTRKSILDAPVELIQGGVGIVVRECWNWTRRIRFS
jgi:sensor domain CHASE-containing protein